MCLRELLKGRMMAVKEVVMSSFYRFYPPILVHDFILSLPITEKDVRCDFNTLARELMDVAYIMKSELGDYGKYLGYLKYYINAPFDVIDGDFEKNVETLRVLKQR